MGKVLYDKLLIRPLDHSMSPGGVVIPQVASQNVERGVVVCAGDGYIPPGGEKLIPLIVKPESVVVYQRGDGVELVVEGKRHIVLPERQVLYVEG